MSTGETTSLDRRSFLRGGGAVAGGAVATTGLAGLLQRSASADHGTAAPRVSTDAGDYGPLDARTPVAAGPGADAGSAYLSLPEGFAYTVFGVEGTRMADGRVTPRAHDGMAPFLLPDGRIRLVRNHEDRSSAEEALREGGALCRPAYDPVGRGGTTTLEITLDGAGPMAGRSFLSLGGTIVNCAGGPTPWGSWLTCEETTEGRSQGWRRDHGYVFEVPADHDLPAPPVPLRAMGRFVHEAVAVDPGTGTVYETEDTERAGLYRFLPHRRRRLRAGGRLQMLAVRGEPGVDLRRLDEEGAHLPVEWVHVPDPDPETAELDEGAVFAQGHDGGGAVFRRLEGCWWGNGAVYLNSTDGGPAELGQVWGYRPSGDPDLGELTLVVVAEEAGVLDGPDNLTVSDRAACWSARTGTTSSTCAVCSGQAEPTTSPATSSTTGSGRGPAS